MNAAMTADIFRAKGKSSSSFPEAPTIPQTLPKPVNLAMESNEDLFNRFLNGDDGAFKTLYRLHNPKLVRHCHFIVRDKEAAENLTQDMWEKVIRMRLDPPDEPVKNLLGLFMTILRRDAINYLKNPRVRVFNPLPDNFDIEEKETEESKEYEELLHQYLAECLNDLEETTREILELHFWSKFSFVEIAGMLGMKPEAVYARVSRAKSVIRRFIERELRNNL